MAYSSKDRLPSLSFFLKRRTANIIPNKNYQIVVKEPTRKEKEIDVRPGLDSLRVVRCSSSVTVQVVFDSKRSKFSTGSFLNKTDTYAC